MSLKDVQARLRAWGYTGPLDGLWGPGSEGAALRALEAADAAVAPADALPGPDAETRLLMAELEREEARVPHAYLDSEGYWTIGIGRLIDKRKGGRLTDAEIDMLLANDIAEKQAQLDAKLPWWRGLDPVRQRAIQQMAFQMGVGELAASTVTIPLIRDGRYADAARQLSGWKWARQTPERAERVISMIKTGTA